MLSGHIGRTLQLILWNTIFPGAVEINLPIDKFTKKIKGYAVVKFLPPENAVKAFSELDGTIFQVIFRPFPHDLHVAYDSRTWQFSFLKLCETEAQFTSLMVSEICNVWWIGLLCIMFYSRSVVIDILDILIHARTQGWFYSMHDYSCLRCDSFKDQFQFCKHQLVMIRDFFYLKYFEKNFSYH